MDTNANPSLTRDGFQDIALSFSGGGFRAAAFSLGALSYLYRARYDGVSLLSKVRFITSTSGGSFTNAFYAYSLHKGKKDFDFPHFYQQLREAIGEEELLKQAFEQLMGKTVWPEEGKQRNLINAFAKAYDNKIFNGGTLGDLIEPPADAAHPDNDGSWEPHLEKICLNTTELNNGLNFYFKASAKEQCVEAYGNGYLRFKDEPAIRKLKLSDIVAASSCFPAGFEPILFPADFVHAGNPDPEALIACIQYDHNLPTELAAITNGSFGLMDGGITDNMGLHALGIENDRRARPFDLMISCDVTSYFNKAYTIKTGHDSWWKRRLTVQLILNAWKFSWVIFVACVVALCFGRFEVPALLLLLPSLLFGLAFFFARQRLAALERANTGAWSLAFGYVRKLLRLPLSRLLPFLATRTSSTLKLVTDLFLKQARRDQYNSWFGGADHINRVLACLIYEFSPVHEKRRLENLEERDGAWWPGMKGALTPSAKIQAYAEKARKMGTTLWFANQDKDRRDVIIVTGQFTMCYNLIKQICRLEKEDPKFVSDRKVQDLKAFLLADWARFQNTPDFLLASQNLHP
jgi:predicted acylesterase/phospholipase RssA